MVSRGSTGRQRASGNDIFLLGMLSKMLATVLTYPLIQIGRAHV